MSGLSIEKLRLEGAFLVKPFISHDARGSFVKLFTKELLAGVGVGAEFSEEFFSISKKGVVRGFHYQRAQFSQARLVWVPKGSVYDVIVDLRKGSPTFGESEALELSDVNMRMLYIPRGFAHAFQSLADGTVMVYKADSAHSPENERGIIFSDRKLGVRWPVAKPILSEKDSRWPGFEECEKF